MHRLARRENKKRRILTLYEVTKVFEGIEVLREVCLTSFSIERKMLTPDFDEYIQRLWFPFEA